MDASVLCRVRTSDREFRSLNNHLLYEKIIHIIIYLSIYIVKNYWHIPFGNVSVSGNTITLHLVDGRTGDDTGVDGIIVDQGGPAAPEPVAIPTMNEWGVIIFMALAALASIASLIRRRRANP